MKNIVHFTRFLPIFRRHWAKVFFVLWVVSLSNLGHAACFMAAPGQTFLFTIMPPATITVPRDAAVGTVIFSRSAVATGGNGVGCTAGTFWTWINTGRGNAIRGIIPTGIPGIGYLGTTGVQDSGTFNVTTLFSITDPSFIHTKTITFVKTGPIASGSIVPAGLLLDGLVNNLSNERVMLGSPFTVIAQTCNVTTPNVVVNLSGASGIPVSQFTGLGSTSTAVPFSISWDCSGSTVPARVFMTMTDSQNPANTSTTLGLSRASTATGVGIQVLSDAPDFPPRNISFGPDSSLAGNPGQFRRGLSPDDGTGSGGVASDGIFTSMWLTARYIQTAAAVTPGTANAIATFTMSYQ